MLKNEIKPHRLQISLRNYIGLAFILLLAIVLRISFPTGMAPPESIYIAKAAYAQTTAIIKERGEINPHFSLDQINKLRSEFGDRRLIFALPVSLLYFVFGVNDFTTLAYPFLVSIAGVILIYQLALFLVGQKAAIISAFLWAILPSDIYFGTTLLPHGPQTVFSILAILTFLYAENSTNPKKKRLVYYSISLIALLLSIAILRSGGLSFVYFFCMILVAKASKYWDLWRILMMVFLMWFLASLWFVFQIQKPIILSAITTEVFSEPLFYILLPNFLGALVWMTHRQDAPSKLPLIWTAVGFGFFSLAIYNNYEPNILLLALPLVIVISNYFTAFFDLSTIKKMASTMAIFLLIATLFVRQAPRSLIAPLDSGLASQWLNPQLIRQLSPLFLGVAFVLSFAAFVVFSSKNHKKMRPLVFLLLITSGMASFGPIHQRNKEEIYLVNATKSTQAILNQQSLRLPIYVPDKQIANRLAYEIGFEHSNQEEKKDPSQLTINVLPNDAKINQSAYIFSSASPVNVISETWWPIQRLGDFGDKTFWLYRLLIEEDADLEFIHADDQLRSNSSLENEFRYYGAALNAGRFCIGYDAWMRSVDFHTDAIQFIPLNNNQECFSDQRSEENRLLLLDHSHRSDWFSYPENLMLVEAVTQAQIEGSVVSVKRHPHDSVLYDNKSIFQTVTFESRSFYLVQITLLSKQEIAPIYWFVDGYEYYFELGRAIPEWTTIMILLATPDWATGSQQAVVSPFTFIEDLGLVYIKDFSIYAFRD